jgi:hypothetical protein
MDRPRCYIFACIILVATTTVGRSEDAQPIADLRCMAVMAKINQLPDPKRQLESLIGGYYYLGRLQATDPALDLGTSTATAYAKMSPAEFLSETARCELEMRTSGHIMTGIGAAMPKIPPSGEK